MKTSRFEVFRFLFYYTTNGRNHSGLPACIVVSAISSKRQGSRLAREILR
jgi:hypothetical protein